MGKESELIAISPEPGEDEIHAFRIPYPPRPIALTPTDSKRVDL